MCKEKIRQCECGEPLNPGIAPNVLVAMTVNFLFALSRTHYNHMHDTDAHTHQNECTAERMGRGRCLVDISDRLAKGGVVASRSGLEHPKDGRRGIVSNPRARSAIFRRNSRPGGDPSAGQGGDKHGYASYLPGLRGGNSKKRSSWH